MIDKDIEMLYENLIKLMINQSNSNQQLEFNFYKPKDIIVESSNKNKFSSGDTCVKCNVFYPYAEPSVNFKCWECKNFK